MPKALDPLNVNERLYKQLAKVLDDLEANSDDYTTPQRINALIAIARVQGAFMALRKEDLNDRDTGSTVRKYSKTFAANAARGRKTNTRPVESEPDAFQWNDSDDDPTDAA
jgi:hypothetical protein